MSYLWTIVGDAGAIASIIGGVFAWLQAKKAKDYAEGIKEGKREAKDRSISNRLSELKSLSKEIKNQLSPTYVESKTVKEIQTKLNEYLTSYSDILGDLNDQNRKQFKGYYDTIHSKTALLEDDPLLNNNLSQIQYLIGQVILESAKIINQSIYYTMNNS